MPTWTFVKKFGAPSGALNVSVAAGRFLLDDGSNTSFATSDAVMVGDLEGHPFVQLAGPPVGAPAPQQIQGVELVDGVLSTQGPGGTYTPIPQGPAGAPGIALNWRGGWTSGATYSNGPPPDGVIGSNGLWYQSVTSGNIGHDPTTDGGVNWIRTPIVARMDLVNTFKPSTPGSNVFASSVDLTTTAGRSSTVTQSFIVTGTPVSGTFGVTYRSNSVSIPYNSNANQVEALLMSMPDVNADGGLTCTGGPLPATVIATWNNSLTDDGLEFPLFGIDNSALVGGTVAARSTTLVYPAGTGGLEVDQWGRTHFGSNPEVSRTVLDDSRNRYVHGMYDPADHRPYFEMMMLRMRGNPVNIEGGRTTGKWPDTPGKAYLASAVTNASTSIPLDTNTRGDIHVSAGSAGFQGAFGGPRIAGIEDGTKSGVFSYASLAGNSLGTIVWLEESTPGQTYSTNAKVSDLLVGGQSLLIQYGAPDTGVTGWRSRPATAGWAISPLQPYAFKDTGGSGGFYCGGVWTLAVAGVGAKGHPSVVNTWLYAEATGNITHAGGGAQDPAHALRKFNIGGPIARLRLSSATKTPGGTTFDSSGNIASLPLRSVTDWPNGGGIKIGVPGATQRCAFSSIDYTNNLVLGITGGTPNLAVPDNTSCNYSWLTLPTELPVSDVGNFQQYTSGTLAVNRNNASYTGVDTVNRKLTGITWRIDTAVTASASTDTFSATSHGIPDHTQITLLDSVGGAPLVNGNTYYTRDTTTSTFKVSTTVGGTAIDLTTNLTSALVRWTPTSPPTSNPIDGDNFVTNSPNFTQPVFGVGGAIVANDDFNAPPRTRSWLGAGLGPNGEAGVGIGPAADSGFIRTGLATSKWLGSLEVPGSLTSGGIAAVLTNDTRLSAAASAKLRTLALSAQGLKAETFFSNQVVAQATMPTGTTKAVLFETGFAAGDVITGLVLPLGTLGVGTQPTLFKVGLADTSGNLVAVSSDQKALLASPTVAGKIQVPFTSPVTIPSDGAYYGVVLQVGTWGTTQPQLGCRTSTVSSIAGGAAPGGVRSTVSQAGQTDLVTSISLANGDGQTYWLGAY